jgi:preprotein translocase subunit SecF
MSRLGAIGGRLYRGEVSFDFVSRKKLWYTISGLILVISIAALAFRGLNYSVEFKGGNLFLFKAPHTTSAQISSTVKSAGGGDGATVTQLGLGSKAQWQVQTDKLSFGEQTKVAQTLASTFHVRGGANAVSITFTSASWGSQITHKAFEGLIVFLILIVIYLSIAFEWQMALAAFVALIHDIVITIGVYALAGFQVSPATVIGSQAANLALNQTLVRSINTSLIALLPVTAILVVAVAYLGTGELQDLALVLFVGMLSGTYSSIFIATPVLASLKEGQPKYKQLARRVALRESGGRAAQRARAKAEKAGRAPGAGRGADADSGAAGAGPADDAPLTDAELAAELVDAEDAEYDEVTDDANDDSADPGTDDRIPAGRTASGSTAPRTPAPGARTGPRQQPRRSSAAKRRPAGKKKRR